MRLIGIDFGFKRIGVAIAETEFGVVTPRPAVAASGTLKKDADAISAMARREEADAVVIGLPVETAGEEGRMARVCRTLGSHIAGNGLVVHFVDESMTSVQADDSLREEGLKASQRRKLRDGEAAALILERFLHEQTT
ncbi:MAG: Holliday junction resolvase RuvX [Fimbriimonas sp.]|nr:Holliday junction resolvase RuvX [Fimbriimonas sp.]